MRNILYSSACPRVRARGVCVEAHTADACFLFFFADFFSPPNIPRDRDESGFPKSFSTAAVHVILWIWFIAVARSF